jgi:hypothetical protein
MKEDDERKEAEKKMGYHLILLSGSEGGRHAVHINFDHYGVVDEREFRRKLLAVVNSVNGQLWPNEES